MQYFTVTWLSVPLVLVLVCSIHVSPAAAEECTVSEGVKCGTRSTEGSCSFRNCTDPVNNVSVSFSACMEQEGSSTVSIKTNTHVTCPCRSGSGDVTVRVELPDERMRTYRDLSTTPDPDLLNATRCDNGMQRSQPYSYCIMFTGLTMVETINGTKLISEVTEGVRLDSSRSCIVIRFPAPMPTPPPSGASSGLSTPKTVNLFLSLLGAYILVKLLDESHFFTT